MWVCKKAKKAGETPALPGRAPLVFVREVDAKKILHHQHKPNPDSAQGLYIKSLIMWWIAGCNGCFKPGWNDMCRFFMEAPSHKEMSRVHSRTGLYRPLRHLKVEDGRGCGYESKYDFGQANLTQRR